MVVRLKNSEKWLKQKVRRLKSAVSSLNQVFTLLRGEMENVLMGLVSMLALYDNFSGLGLRTKINSIVSSSASLAQILSNLSELIFLDLFKFLSVFD